MTSIGKQIRALRKAKGWTQGELAKAAGLSQTTMSDLERGRNQGSRELDVIAAALDVTPAALRKPDAIFTDAKGNVMAIEIKASRRSGRPPIVGEILALMEKIDDVGLADLRGQAKQLVKTNPRRSKVNAAK
jgi:transcriptional regulator with XRE-family HTH domain